MPVRATRTLVTRPSLPAPLKSLERLASNLLWTWQPGVRRAFTAIDPDLWETAGRNPVRLLQSLTPADLHRLTEDEQYIALLAEATAEFDAYLAAPTAPVDGLSVDGKVAYFSLEFALSASLPIYSGGLGVLAGDHLKSASDLSIPLVGVGLFYHQGYFQQVLASDGWQNEEYSTVDPAFQPFTLATSPDGSAAVVSVTVGGRTIHARAWEVHVGRIRLILLDANIDANSPSDREVTARLYGGDSEMRLRQEAVLGIGGVRILRELGINAEVYHMNEGHSSFLGLERSRVLVDEQQMQFGAARLAVAASTVFTTHTPVAAGIDVFPADMLIRQLADEFPDAVLNHAELVGLGRIHPGDHAEPLSMAVLGLRLSRFRNGVSELHGDVSRRLWSAAWYGVPEEFTPIGSVTNGVHLPTWVAPEMASLFDRQLGNSWRTHPADETSWERLKSAPAAGTWEIRNRKRQELVDHVRATLKDDALSRGLPAGQPALDPNALTIGFARRFAMYKRANLLFRDPARLARIVNDPERPVQFLFAGKAHPRDEQAKGLIREVMSFTRMPEFRGKIVLLERYDMDLAAHFVQGSDIWLNNPERPLEASGTSGMKAVANGALHASVLDGWWAEAYSPGLGWAIGADILEDPAAQAARDAESLYELLETEIRGAFYTRDADGVPQDWMRRVHGSIAAYAPRFNTDRMVLDYTRAAYAPAAIAGAAIREGNYHAARELDTWLQLCRQEWHGMKILSVDDNSEEFGEPSTRRTIQVQLHPSRLRPSDLRVDACWGSATLEGVLTPDGATALSLDRVTEDGTCLFSGQVRIAGAGRSGYAIRVLPSHPSLAWPLDTGLILWA